MIEFVTSQRLVDMSTREIARHIDNCYHVRMEVTREDFVERAYYDVYLAVTARYLAVRLLEESR